MNIVILDGYTINPGDLSWDGLKQLGDVVIYDRTTKNEILERSRDAAILFTNKVPLDGSIIKQLPSLKFIGVLATGFNVIDIEAAKLASVIVSNVPGYSTDSVVQMTFALLLEHCHHVQRHSDSVRGGEWSEAADWCYWNSPLIELAGKTIGIIGFGRIGRKVGDVASSFGMNIIGAGRHQTDQSHRNNFRWATIPDLLEQSDVVSIHCPLVPETKGLINKESLQLMKTSGFLINTSRGPIIVDDDLADALNNKVIAGAGIDVLSVEPPLKNNPLFHAKNCIITPHIAWATKEARSRLMDMAISNLSAFIAGKPVNVVNK